MENDKKNNIKDFFSKLNYKFLSIAAIVLSIVSIIFSSISLTRGNRHDREFFGKHRGEMREYMWENDSYDKNPNNFQKPNYGKNSDGDRQFGGNKDFGNKRGGNRQFNGNNNSDNFRGGNRNFNDNDKYNFSRDKNFNNNDFNRGDNSGDRSARNNGPTTAPDITSP